ncbi:MAG: hypothetical protein KF880_11510 [Ferruginibacter sp.]|nr:hypothetical protein [Ferruginibacter sp.]
MSEIELNRNPKFNYHWKHLQVEKIYLEQTVAGFPEGSQLFRKQLSVFRFLGSWGRCEMKVKFRSFYFRDYYLRVNSNSGFGAGFGNPSVVLRSCGPFLDLNVYVCTNLLKNAIISTSATREPEK